jgi:transposase
MRTRAERLAHVQPTKSPDHPPDIGANLAYKANRGGVAEPLTDAAVPKHSEVGLALITDYDALLRDLGLPRVQTAKTHDANPLDLRHTVPGLGTILSRVLRYETHAMARFPRGQDVVSYGRLVQGAKESAGTRWGPSGKDIGSAHLKGAFSEAAAVCLRNTPQGQKPLVRLAKQPDKGNALTILAHTLARAV